MNNVVTISGLPGSGTTTLSRILHAELDLPYVYAGEIFRDQAEERGMSLSEFSALCQDDPRVDQALDAKQVELMQNATDGLVLEGRLSGWMAQRNDVPALKVWLQCSSGIRHDRILAREGGDLVEQIQLTSERERSEADRYQRYYGIDLLDLSIYDLVLDSGEHDPDALAQAVQDALAAGSD